MFSVPNVSLSQINNCILFFHCFHNRTDETQNNFYLRKIQDNDHLLFQYFSATGGFFQVIINFIGDMNLVSSVQTNSEFSKVRHLDLELMGNIVNIGTQAFSSIVAIALGIDTKIWQHPDEWCLFFFRIIMFNSGVLRFGENPKEMVNLSLTMSRNNMREQSIFLKKTLLKIVSPGFQRGNFAIRGSLNYYEY